MNTTTTRRAGQAGAATLPALAFPALAAPTTDADLIALGRHYEKLLLKYVDANLQWAPLHRAAKDEICEVTDARQAATDRANADPSSPYPFDLIHAENDAFNAAMQRNGCEVVGDQMSKLSERMEPIAEAIQDKSASSLGGLRAKALVMLFEALPGSTDHDGMLEFADDGGASRSLFYAVAALTGLAPIVEEIEARVAADAAVSDDAAVQL